MAYLYTFMVVIVIAMLTSCKSQSQKNAESSTKTKKPLQRVFRIEVVDVSSGDTIILKYTDNSARYTKAYKKH